MQAISEELKCPVCLELFDDPVFLACSHSVCRKCAALQIEAQQTFPPLTTFACPLCREPTPIQDGVASLKKNHHLCNVVDQLRRHESAAAAAGPTCGRCEERPATCGCEICGVLYCQTCRADVHIGAFARHTLTDVDSFQRSAQRAKQLCQRHSEALKLYCPRCTELVCTVCGMFGDHKDHGCKPVEDAGECLPPVEDTEEAVRTVMAEAQRLAGVLDQAEMEVLEDFKESHAECKKAFEALLHSLKENVHQRLELVHKQQKSIVELQGRATGTMAKLPGAKVEFPERLALHCLASGLAREMRQLEVVAPPLLRLTAAAAAEAEVESPNVATTTLVQPKLPSPTAGEKHRCQAWLPYGIPVPEFRLEPVAGLVYYSNQHRRCRRDGGDGYLLGKAKEACTSGQFQFSVHVIQQNNDLWIGVVVVNAPINYSPYGFGNAASHHGVFLSHSSGNISAANFSQRYTTYNCLPAGCRVTMLVDFANQTVSYEVDGRPLGEVKGLTLPQGPLYPAILFTNSGTEVEFVAATAGKQHKRKGIDAAGRSAKSARST